MRKTIRKTIIYELKILRCDLQTKETDKLHKSLKYIEITSFIRGYCYGLSDDISVNSYKLLTNYMDSLYDKYLAN